MVIILHRFQHVSTGFDATKKVILTWKTRNVQPKKFEDEEVEALLDQDPSQTQEELTESSNVDRLTRLLKIILNDSKARKLGAVRVEIKECQKA